MQNQENKSIEFNGQPINLLAKDGQYWIAIKPICEALGVDYIAQYKAIQKDQILGGVLSKQTMHDAQNRLQEMVALPEKYVYGWLFSVNSKSDVFQQYKRKCYDVLYDYFHGALTGRKEMLTDKALAEKERREIEEQLRDNPLFKKYEELKGKEIRLGKQLKESDRSVIKSQLGLL